MSIGAISFLSSFGKVTPVQRVASQPIRQQNQNKPTLSFGDKYNLKQDTFTRSNPVENKENPGVSTPSGMKVSKEQQSKLKNRHNEVKSHEEAHKAAGGTLAGSPVYEYNAYGYIQNGHVSIMMPAVNKNDPQKSKSQAETVRSAALAPGSFSELSSADKNVAKNAEKVISQSSDLISKKNKEDKTQKA